MSHWNCFVHNCTNSHHTVRITGKVLKPYRVPKKHLEYYKEFFKTDNVNWEYARICSAHWSKPRVNRDHLPDLRITSDNRPKPRVALSVRAKRRNWNRKKARLEPTEEECAGSIAPLQALLQTAERAKSKLAEDEGQGRINSLEAQLKVAERAKSQLENKHRLLNTAYAELHAKFQRVEAQKSEAERKITALKEELKQFSWKEIDNETVHYLTGFSPDEFQTIYQLFSPYLHLIKYAGCSQDSFPSRALSKDDELFSVLIILRHGVEEGIVAWMVGISASTMYNLFVAWITFGSAICSKIDLSHSKELILKMMPKHFSELGYQNAVLLLDATELKLTCLSNLKPDCLFFSDCNNTHTAKGLVGITPHGALCTISDLHPGSVSDSELTTSTGALDYVQSGDCILADERFNSGECDAEFMVSALRIHVECWISCMRDYAILNRVWHTDRMDLLHEVWKFIGHLVNITSLVGSKE